MPRKKVESKNRVGYDPYGVRPAESDQLNGTNMPSGYVNRTGRRARKLYISVYHAPSEWICACDCGNNVIATTRGLVSGKADSCGQCDNKKQKELF